LCDVMFSRWLVVFEISSVWMMYTTFLEVDWCKKPLLSRGWQAPSTNRSEQWRCRRNLPPACSSIDPCIHAERSRRHTHKTTTTNAHTKTTCTSCSESYPCQTSIVKQFTQELSQRLAAAQYVSKLQNSIDRWELAAMMISKFAASLLSSVCCHGD
jgi:hypothetical protein